MPVKRFNTQDKLNVLTLLRTGMSKKSIARLLQIDKREITIWDLRYQQYGLSGLEPARKRVISQEFKRQAVEEYLAGGVSMRQLCTKYNVCLSSLKNWLRQYRKEEVV